MTRTADHDLTLRFATRAVHAGQAPDPLAGAVMTPIYQTSTYVQEGIGRNKGYEYARTRNPTREALERNVAALEGARHGFAFGSGLAALDTLLKLLSEGDHVVCGENVYGGTHRQMTHVWARLGLRFTFVDPSDPQRIADAVRPETKLVYAETPTNPMMRLCDLAAARHTGVFFGVLPRSAHGAGTAADIIDGLVAWVDLDFKDFAGGEAEARKRLAEFPLQPTIIVRSGHGLHAYWLLSEPASPQELSDHSRRLALVLGGDKAFDAPRLLRLPGTANRKAIGST